MPGIVPDNENLYKLSNGSGRELFPVSILQETNGALGVFGIFYLLNGFSSTHSIQKKAIELTASKEMFHKLQFFIEL